MLLPVGVLTVQVDNVKFCYCDESGMGSEHFAVMVGVVVDSSRMHVTKDGWRETVAELAYLCGKTFRELHASDFYSGNGLWRSLSGAERAEIISGIFNWIGTRKHHFVYTSVDKDVYFYNRDFDYVPPEIGTVWRCLAFHLILAMQLHCQKAKHNKGNTVFLFDKKNEEEKNFPELILNPPEWSHEYYKKPKSKPPLDQVVDVPLFVDSRHVGLIQVADIAAFFLRRYAEICEGMPLDYPDEKDRVTQWMY
jgi:hypothetical protein